MVHTCDDCGQMCYCDWDDSNNALGSYPCLHDCDGENDEEAWEEA